MSLLDPQHMPTEFYFVGPRSRLKKNLIPLIRQYVADDVDDARQIWALTVLECQGQPHAVAARLNHLVARGRAERSSSSRVAWGYAELRGWVAVEEHHGGDAAARQIWAEGETDPADSAQTSAAELDAALERAAAMLPRQTTRALRMSWAGADREEVLAVLSVDDRRLRQMLGDAELAVRAGAHGGLRAAAAVLRARSDRRHAPSPAPAAQLSLLDEEVCHV